MKITEAKRSLTTSGKRGLVSDPAFNVLDRLESNLVRDKIGIVEFAEGQSFCGKILYPKQKLLLKLMFLEPLNELEEEFLDKWIVSKEVGIPEDIRERVAWCKEQGYPHFREIVLVGGRRSSKGFVTGMVLAKKMYDMFSLQDPNAYYGIDANKEIYFTCVAASEKQAKELQYADFATTVDGCAALHPYVHKMQELEFSLHTDQDQKRYKDLREEGRRVQRDISRLRGRALAANARTLRGYTSAVIVFDEFAHFIQGDASQADDEVYEAAIPSLAQFGRDGMLLVNSSPYSKVGKFYDRYVEGFAREKDRASSPMMLPVQFPSWALFEDWWKDPFYRGSKHCITVSPDWDIMRKSDDGAYYYTEEDRAAIAVERAIERDNPEKYKVERRARFAETIDAYLMPEMVDRMFSGKPLEDGRGYTPLYTNKNDSSYRFKYKIHLDPSSTTAGFGFALAHVEELEVRGKAGPHVVFDIIKRWNPADFDGGVIDWDVVLEEVIHYVDIFRPFEVTMDQHQSRYPISWLRKEALKKGAIECRIYEKTASAQSNWDAAEVFKTALYQGLVHAPNDTEDTELAALELKYLQEYRTGQIPRVDKQEHGPVTTKDMGDAIMACTESLIGDVMAKEARESLSELPRFGAAHGYPIGGHDREGKGVSHPFGDFYRTRLGEQSVSGGVSKRKRPRGLNPARRAFGGRPVPKRFFGR